MKLLRLILCLCTGVTLLHGGDRGDGHNWPQRFRMPPPRAWLGLEVSKPDETITAHLPDLPQGIGFVIRSIEKGGPAETAGLRDLDVICKFNDQLLVNESQLAALLRLANPGEEVKLTGFRAGKPLAATDAGGRPVGIARSDRAAGRVSRPDAGGQSRGKSCDLLE